MRSDRPQLLSFPSPFLPEPPGRYIFLIGGGGKTSLMFALAHSLSQAGQRVLTTTTTKIHRPQPEISECVFAGAVSDILPRIREEFSRRRHITIARSLLPSGKLGGFSTEELDEIRRVRIADYIVAEADGSAGRSLKAHGDFEPVISPDADLVAAVIGIDCLGKPPTDEWIHRSHLFRERLGKTAGDSVTAGNVAGIFFHPRGYLHNTPASASLAVFLSKVRSPQDRNLAKTIAAALEAEDKRGRLKWISAGDIPFHRA